MSDEDGRYTANHIARHYLCGWCWSPLAVKWDNDEKKYKAVCPLSPFHIARHHYSWVERVQAQSNLDRTEFDAFYRRTPYAGELGIKPLDTDYLHRARVALRGDGAGLD